LLEKQIIRESKSPFAAPLVVVRKKDGSIRLCCDYRGLNKKTVRDAHPLPRIDESLDALSGAKYFSSLELAQGYLQVGMAKTAFTSPFGLYEFNRLPFGLCNAPATFQRLMQAVVGDLMFQILLVYLDDLLVYSSTFEDHLKRLDIILMRLTEAGLKLKPEKCHLFLRMVAYLGHEVSERGIATDHKKIEAVRKWKKPSSLKELRSFIGFASYYRRFVSHFAKIAGPLTDLVTDCVRELKEHKTLKPPFQERWKNLHQGAFDALREKIISAPILAYADYSLPFILETDIGSPLS
jgi:hypothetical protein